MLDQYRKTFVGMQLVIAMVTAFVYLAGGHQWAPAAMFFATMQIASGLGAYWGHRLRRRIQGRT
jgi:uncharacterized membrane protein YfcA